MQHKKKEKTLKTKYVLIQAFKKKEKKKINKD